MTLLHDLNCDWCRLVWSLCQQYRPRDALDAQRKGLRDADQQKIQMYMGGECKIRPKQCQILLHGVNPKFLTACYSWLSKIIPSL